VMNLREIAQQLLRFEDESALIAQHQEELSGAEVDLKEKAAAVSAIRIQLAQAEEKLQASTEARDNLRVALTAELARFREKESSVFGTLGRLVDEYRAVTGLQSQQSPPAVAPAVVPESQEAVVAGGDEARPVMTAPEPARTAHMGESVEGERFTALAQEDVHQVGDRSKDASVPATEGTLSPVGPVATEVPAGSGEAKKPGVLLNLLKRIRTGGDGQPGAPAQAAPAQSSRSAPLGADHRTRKVVGGDPIFRIE